MVVRVYTIALFSLVVTWLAFFIFSKKKTQKLWLVLLGLAPLILIYALNPNLRIYSFHGFRHAGIVYQLLEGNVPPYNPLFGGELLIHPWGWHCLAAFISHVFNITPFYSFAFINAVSLCLTMVLVYQISRLVIKDEKANIFSVLIAIFTTAILDIHLVLRLSQLFHISIPFEIRGIPLFDKFSNINGAPLGLTFFFLSLFSLIKLFQNKNVWINALLFFISLLCCGFLYPSMLPGIVASTGLFCVVSLLSPHNEYFARDLKKIILLSGLLIMGMLFLMPYFLSITSGIKTNVELFNLSIMPVKIAKYLLVTFPLLILLYIKRSYLQNNTNRTAIRILLTVIIATFSCHIVISLPMETEIKYFMLSTGTLGIVGGIAFQAMNRGFMKPVVFILVLFFLAPLYRHVKWKARLLNKAPHVSTVYVEKEKYLYTKNAEENELYEWIRNHTDKNSIFIDSALTIPVLAQRQLFIGMDNEVPLGRAPIGMSGIYSGEPGYGSTIDSYLRLINGYDPDLIDTRQAHVKRIYAANRKGTDTEMKKFFNAHKNMYVVVRTKALEDKFKGENFDQVFRSSQGNFLVFQTRSP